jgi:hypothetical protein
MAIFIKSHFPTEEEILFFYFTIVHQMLKLCDVESYPFCYSITTQFLTNTFWYFRVHALLRVGLIKIDENKLKKMDPGISSVSLSQVTPIIVVLASGIAVAIFITIVERLLFWKTLHYKFQGIKHKRCRKNIKHFISEFMLLRIFKRD